MFNTEFHFNILHSSKCTTVTVSPLSNVCIETRKNIFSINTVYISYRIYILIVYFTVREKYSDINPVWFNALYGNFEPNYNYTSEMWDRLKKIDLNTLIINTRTAYSVHRKKVIDPKYAFTMDLFNELLHWT